MMMLRGRNGLGARGLVSGRWAMFVGLLAVLLAVRPELARAGEGDDPEKLIKRGNDLRRQGDNIRAFGYLQRAHELAGTPRTGAQLGLCEQALGRFFDAETHLTTALSTNDAWIEANRASLESSRALVRKKLGRVQITGAPPGTTVAVGNAAAQRLPSDGAVWVAPGATSLTLEAPGFRVAARSATVSEGGSTTVAAGLVAVAGPSAPAAASSGPPPAAAPAGGGSEPERTIAARSEAPPSVEASASAVTPVTGQGDDGSATWRVTGLAVAGGGVALTVGGFVLRHMASTKLSAIERDADALQPYNADNGNWKTFEGSGIALLTAGGAAVVTGAVLYLMNRGGDEAGPAAAGGVSSSTRSRGGRGETAGRFWAGWTRERGVAVGFAALF